MKRAKAKCEKEKLAGFTIAKRWQTVYLKWAAHNEQVDFQYTCPEDPANSVDTHMFLTDEGAATWGKRAEEFHEWKNKEEHKNLLYEEFEKGASWECDPRQTQAYQQQDQE